MTVFWLPDNLYRDTAHVPIYQWSATMTNFQPLIKLVPRSLSCSISRVPGLQKRAPYPSCTGTTPGPNGTIDWPVAASGNTNYHNCRAVMAHCLRPLNYYRNLKQTLNQSISQLNISLNLDMIIILKKTI
jgi:hypothetical protein